MIRGEGYGVKNFILHKGVDIIDFFHRSLRFLYSFKNKSNDECFIKTLKNPGTLENPKISALLLTDLFRNLKAII